MFFVPRGGLLLYFTHKLIQTPIPISGHIGSIAKEHMLHPIETIENAAQNTLMKILDQMEKDLFAPFKDQLTQIQKLVIVDATFLETGCILRPAKG